MVAPSSVRADVPGGLDAIAMRAMSAEASERYQSARELSEALERYLVRRDPRPTHTHIRRWMERQLFDPERASLQRQIAQGCDVEVALSLLGTPRAASGAFSAAQRRGSLRPRALWSESHSAHARVAHRSVAPPRLYEEEARPVSRDPLPNSDVVERRFPAIPGAPTLPSGLEPLSEPEPAESAPPRRWPNAVMLGTCAAVALGASVYLSALDRRSTTQISEQAPGVSQLGGQVDVRSSPDGATVFVDGEPTGLRTPVVLKGLTGGRRLRLRVEKAGYASQEREIEVAAGAVGSLAFELLASDGRVRFEGAPADARIYVDDALIAGGAESIRLSAGRHTVRVESQGFLVYSGTVVVVAGEQVISLDPAGARP
jgi:hypothetical protein